MSILETRGGYPHILRETFTITGRSHSLRGFSKWICIRASTNPCKVYFKEEDFDNDTNYIGVPVPSASTPYGEWKGPIETNTIWIKGDGGSSDVEFIAIMRLN
jgi:hypothetical protein